MSVASRCVREPPDKCRTLVCCTTERRQWAVFLQWCVSTALFPIYQHGSTDWVWCVRRRCCMRKELLQLEAALEHIKLWRNERQDRSSQAAFNKWRWQRITRRKKQYNEEEWCPLDLGALSEYLEQGRRELGRRELRQWWLRWICLTSLRSALSS